MNIIPPSGGESGGGGNNSPMVFKSIMTGDNQLMTQKAGTTKKYYIGAGTSNSSVNVISSQPIIINGCSLTVSTAMYGTNLPLNIIAEITAQSDIEFETVNDGYLIEI